MRLGAHKIHTHRRGFFGTWRRKLLAGTVLLAICSVLTVLVVYYQAQAAPCECNVFGTPTGQTLNGGSPLEVGFKFKPSVDGFVSGVRFYKQGSMSGTHTGHLWTMGGVSLATATFSSESASGWQSVTFSSPVAVTANTMYVASVDMADGSYLATANYFTADIVNGPLTAPSTINAGGNGVYSATTGAFPASTFNATNYWVDVAFYSTSPPTVTSVTPTAGSTGSQPGVSVTATFDQAMDATTLNSNTFTVKDAVGNAVSGAVSYNGTTKTATFVATQGFATSQTYTATIKGGTGTVVTNIAGIALAGDDIWSFTTGSTNSCPCSLKNNANPTGTGTFANGSQLELGVKVRPSTNGYITSLRFYKPILSALTTHTGHVWDTAGNSLASVTFSNESSYGWEEAKLATPLQVYQNQTYVVSYTSPDGEYVSSNGTFTSGGITSGYLTVFADGSTENTANGSGTHAGAFSTTGGNYPGTGSATGNYYWVDAVFSTTSAPSNPLTVAVTQPTANAYGIRRDQAITANFSRVPDGATITNATFRLYNAGGSQVAGTAGYSIDQGAATFTPTSPLTNGQRYTAKIAGTVADAGGATLGTEYSWSFTVGSALRPHP